MDQSYLGWIANFIWGIADDVLRDLYVRGKYRDVILPMTVLRRLDSLLEPSKPAVLEMKTVLDTATIIHQPEPRVGVRLRVRHLCESADAHMPDDRRRVDPGVPGD